MALGDVCEEEESGGEADEGKGRPGENGEEPRLRDGENVDAVDVGLEGPRQMARAMGGPEERGGHRYECCSEKGGEDSVEARGCDGLWEGGRSFGAASGA